MLSVGRNIGPSPHGQKPSPCVLEAVSHHAPGDGFLSFSVAHVTTPCGNLCSAASLHHDQVVNPRLTGWADHRSRPLGHAYCVGWKRSRHRCAKIGGGFFAVHRRASHEKHVHHLHRRDGGSYRAYDRRTDVVTASSIALSIRITRTSHVIASSCIIPRDRQHRTETFAYCKNCYARHCRYLHCFPH